MSENKNVIIVVIAILFFVMLIITGVLVGVAMILSSQKSTPEPITTVVEQTIVPTSIKVSKFANDAGFIKIKDSLKAAQSKIDSMDLFEQQITPPVFDTNISIAPQL